MFAPQLGQQAVAGFGAGGSAAIIRSVKSTNTFPPGSSISVQLVRGDYSLAAAGTVTCA